jgi:hypothetical protein
VVGPEVASHEEPTKDTPAVGLPLTPIVLPVVLSSAGWPRSWHNPQCCRRHQ